MAFVNRIGNMLKESVSRNTNLELCASRTSLYQAIRSMSSSKLFVGGLSYSTDETSLKEAFSQHGEVIDARVILDRDSGRSRGFGFVSYTSTEEATSALHALDGQDLHGRRIRVNYATEKRPAGFGGGYGSGGGGGYGGYGSGGGGFNYAARNENFGGGGGGNYGSNNSYPVGGGNYAGEGGGYGNSNYGGAQDNMYSGQGNNFGSGGYGGGGNSNDFFNNSEFGSSQNGGGREQFNANQGTESVNEDFTPVSEGSYGDNNDEPNDYANSRG